MKAHDPAQHELIRSSGLFDPAFYRRTYGHLIPDGCDELDYFLDAGAREGHLPSPRFDPALYRLLVPECGSGDPLLHCLSSGASFSAPPLREALSDIASRFPRGAYPMGAADIARNREYAKDAASTRQMRFVAGGRDYALEVPEPEALLGRLRRDEPFAFARLPHGFWDALWLRGHAEKEIGSSKRGRLLSAAEQRALATRLCASARPTQGSFSPLFMEEVLGDIGAHAGNPDFLRAVSFKGCPTFEEDVFGERPLPREGVLGAFADHFRPGQTLYDATLWKRWLIAGPLKALPALCRDRPVVLVANRQFASLGRRWKLADFVHVQIPPQLSQRRRRDLLGQVHEAVASSCSRGGRPPVVLTQCGGALAYWLITRLFRDFPRVFYIDLGQALNGWFFDRLETGESLWMRIYAASVVSRCNLEEFYRRRLRARYDEWLAALAEGRSVKVKEPEVE